MFKNCEAVFEVCVAKQEIEKTISIKHRCRCQMFIYEGDKL